jgi:stage V sporulation protein D (sporulation-specific penicillin-binding protein)
MMVTPLQIARAFSAYANGGHIIRPRIIKGVLDADGSVISRQEPVKLQDTPQIMDEDQAHLMRQILSDVVVRGTAAGYERGARSKRWNLFGKTGTAHISRGRGGYAMDKINASFICGAPFESPRIVVAFIVHEPDRSKGRFGGAVSAPGAKRLVERTLAYLQEPESPPLSPPPQRVIAALTTGFDIKKYGAQTTSSTSTTATAPQH